MRGLNGDRLNARGVIQGNPLLKCLIPVLLWMLIIFCFSAQTGMDSANLSAGFVRYCVDLLFTFATWLDVSFINSSPDAFANTVHGIMRKLAHFFLYSVLGFLLLRYFVHKKTAQIAFLLALSVGICYASLDEYHQTLVAGRGGTISDVLLDSSGVAFGVLVYYIITIIRRKIYSSGD